MDGSHRRLLLRTLCSLLVGLALFGAWTAPTTAKGGSLRLYLSADGTAASFRPVDPVALTDADGMPSLAFDGDYPAIAYSGDGTVIAAVTGVDSSDATVTLMDAATLAVTHRFPIGMHLDKPMLNEDGTLLVLQAWQIGGADGVSTPTWNVYDTSDGSVISQFSGEGQGTEPYASHGALFDPASEQLYLPNVDGRMPMDSARPLRIARYDVRSGEKTGDIELPDVLAGSWFPATTDTGAGEPSNEAQTPGVALSPTGDRLAVVDPATGRVTLVATATMTAERAFVPKRHVGWRQRLAGWLSPFARGAEAKLTEGMMLHAAYAADGRSIYLTGKSVALGDGAQDIQAQGLGIRRIDLDSGEIVAAAVDGAEVAQLWVAPAGDALYALAYDQPWEAAQGAVTTRLIPGEDGDSVIEVVEATPATRLLRLDPATLGVLAERTVSDGDWVLAVPDPVR